MPSSYTVGIQNGTITTLRDFSLLCARAFEAAISLRDEPLAPIPPTLPPDNDESFYIKQIAEAKQRTVALANMTDAEIDQAALQCFEQAQFAEVERRAKRDCELARYKSMREQVQNWTPPTADHEGLKKFMLSQIEESIIVDCSELKYFWPAHLPPAHLPGDEWLAVELAQNARALQNATENLTNARKRHAGRQVWVDALFKSLPHFSRRPDGESSTNANSLMEIVKQ